MGLNTSTHKDHELSVFIRYNEIVVRCHKCHTDVSIIANIEPIFELHIDGSVEIKHNKLVEPKTHHVVTTNILNDLLELEKKYNFNLGAGYLYDELRSDQEKILKKHLGELK
jgi:hypothetical protein